MFNKIKNYLINKFELGILINGDKPVSHRSLLKVFVNPFLRTLFGIQIGSIIDDKTFEFKGYKIISAYQQCGEGRKFKMYLKPTGKYTNVVRERCFV